MRARQYAGTDVDRPDRSGIAAVDTGFAIENLAADNLGLKIEESRFDFVGFFGGGLFSNQFTKYATPDFIQFGRASALALDLVCLVDIGAGGCADLFDQCRILCRRRPIPRLLADFGSKLVDHV